MCSDTKPPYSANHDRGWMRVRSHANAVLEELGSALLEGDGEELKDTR